MTALLARAKKLLQEAPDSYPNRNKDTTLYSPAAIQGLREEIAEAERSRAETVANRRTVLVRIFVTR